MEAIKLCRLDTPIIFIEARINLSRFVVTGCAAKTSATVTFPSLNRSEERFSRNAETDLVCRLLLEKKNDKPRLGLGAVVGVTTETVLESIPALRSASVSSLS